MISRYFNRLLLTEVTSDKDGDKYSNRRCCWLFYTISSIYLFELVIIRILTFNDLLALVKLFMNVPLIKIVTIKDFVRMICIW